MKSKFFREILDYNITPMKTQPESVRFPVIYLSLGGVLSILFLHLFLQLAEQDEILRPLFKKWPPDIEILFAGWGLVMTPIMLFWSSAWWHFKPPTNERLMVFGKLRITMWHVAIGITLLGVWNLIFFGFDSTFEKFETGNSIFSRMLLHQTEVLLSPFFYVPYGMLNGLALWWLFPARSLPEHEVDRVFVFAMTLGGIMGMVFTYFIHN
jgi:hypothetical protein